MNKNRVDLFQVILLSLVLLSVISRTRTQSERFIPRSPEARFLEYYIVMHLIVR